MRMMNDEDDPLCYRYIRTGICPKWAEYGPLGLHGAQNSRKDRSSQLVYGTCYFVLLSELQQPIFRNTASAKAEAQRLMQPALHPVMQAASCRLHTQLTSIFYWAKNHHAPTCASYLHVCEDALPLRSNPDRSKTLFHHCR